MVMPDSHLDVLRTQYDRTLNDTCDIWLKVIVEDDFGGQTATWGEEETGVACAFSSTLGQREQEQVARQGLVVVGQIRLSTDTAVEVDSDLRNVTVDGVNLGNFRIRGFSEHSYKVGRVALVGKVN